MARAVGVGVVSVLCAVLDVSHIDGDASVSLLRGVVNRSIIAELSKRRILGGENLKQAEKVKEQIQTFQFY